MQALTAMHGRMTQARLWRSAHKWVVLWLLLSALTLLHCGALVATLYDVALAKARAPWLHISSVSFPCRL